MKSFSYALFGIAWLCATVALVWSLIGMLVFFTDIWWEIPSKVLEGIKDEPSPRV